MDFYQDEEFSQIMYFVFGQLQRYLFLKIYDVG
jgi:hypothetical protein